MVNDAERVRAAPNDCISCRGTQSLPTYFTEGNIIYSFSPVVLVLTNS
jgi:hypothetical protein